MKFLTSITIFLWTVAWFMPETAARSRLAPRAIVRWTIVSAMLIEIALHHHAVRRAAPPRTSTTTRRSTRIIFGVMGIGDRLQHRWR